MLTPRTVLCRHDQGVDDEAIVQADDTFLHGGQPYTSLQQLARENTGTRWSRPVFFGLKSMRMVSTSMGCPQPQVVLALDDYYDLC